MKIGSIACWRRAAIGSPLTIGAQSRRPVSTSPEAQRSIQQILVSLEKRTQYRTPITQVGYGEKMPFSPSLRVYLAYAV